MLARLPSPKPSSTAPSLDQVENLRWLLNELGQENRIRINCGGQAIRAADGTMWQKDCFYNHGILFHGSEGDSRISHEQIVKTKRPRLYQTERWFNNEREEPAGYTIPIEPGKYQVVLGFAEIYEEGREFQILIENKPLKKAYDPAIAGFATADQLKTTVNVNDGMLNIEFKAMTRNPKISCIEIIPLQQLSPNTL